MPETAMKANGRRNRVAAAVAVVMMMAVARAKAQECGDPAAQRIVVSIPDRKLALIENEQVVKVYSVAVGARRSPSPTGTFKITTRIPEPTWYTPGKVVGPGSDNPLGTRWLGLSLKGFGIHGTNRPRSVGRAASHGCIRLRNSDIEELFEMVDSGTVVELRGERDEETERLFGGPAVAVEAAVAVAKPAPAVLNGGE
jgi:lipoprotein-anchoring transpeptidase ErfK/SrfK